MSTSSVKGQELYSIGQVHAITGIPKPTLRFWEKEFGEYLEPQRSPGNQRRYDRENIQRLERINQLVRDEGYTLEGARQKLEEAERFERETAEGLYPGIEEEHLHKLAETMSDYLLKKLFGRAGGGGA